MATIFDNLARKFKTGTLLIQLIFINVGVFVLIRLIDVVLTLSGIDSAVMLHYLELPANLELLLIRPWTPLTYMFLQFDFLHLLFNMLWLYWFGQLFLHFFSEKQLGGLYLLGGLAGALFFLIAYNVIPYFGYSGWLLGASASVIAIVVATAVYAPDFKVNLLFIGPVSLKYIALVTIVIDMISITSSNGGGHIAHLGGALLGYVFVIRWKKGKDITRGVNLLIDKLFTWFRPKPKMKVSYKRPETDLEYNGRKQTDTEMMNQILDKVKKSGYNSLSSEEKKRLFDVGKKL